MAKTSNFVILPTADDALLWYNGYNPGGQPYPEMPTEGTVIVKFEEGDGIEPYNDWGILFERHLINFGVFEGDVNWSDNDEKNIQAYATADTLSATIETSYDDQDPDSVTVWWMVYDGEDNIVAQGTTSETTSLYFGENETQETRYINFRVEFS